MGGDDVHERRERQSDDPLNAIMDLWSRLDDEERDVILPSLIRQSRLGTKLIQGGIPWRPAYAKA